MIGFLERLGEHSMAISNTIELTASSIQKQSDSFQLFIPIHKKLIANSEEYNFYIKQRNGRKKIALDSNIHRFTGKHAIIKTTIAPPPSQLLKTEKQIWDLFFFTKNEKNELTYRIKTVEDELNLLAILVDNHKKMFYPYRTRHSNLSFVLSFPNVLAVINRVNIAKDCLQIRGYMNYPLLSESTNMKIKKAQLAVAASQNQEEYTFQLTDMVQRKNNPSIVDFYCGINLYDTCCANEKKAFKFFLELDVAHNGSSETLRSERICWINAKRNFKLKSRLNHASFGKRKIKIIARPTKKAKYLSVNITTYDFRNALINETKEKIIKTRRSKWVLYLYKQFFAAIGLLPKKNIIIFESFHGKQFSCSPRAIYEYMNENKMNYKMYWSVDRKYAPQFHQFDIRMVQRFTLKWLFLMPRAKYWITNSRLPGWLPKPKRTIYVQTWHGTPLKKLAADMDEVHMPATNAEKYINNFLKEANKWDYLISPNAYSTQIFRRAFGYTKRIIESGYPRNDFLIHNNNKEAIEKIKQKLFLPLNKKIILYAPTWRDHHYYAKGKYKFEIQIDFNQLKKELADDYIVLLRLHYLIAEELDLSAYKNFVFDFSRHEDIRELYLISDILVTDYSSVFFDYANLKRPMIFFVYDIDEYRDKLRGFYFDFEQNAPGPLVKTTDDLITEIKNLERNNLAYTDEKKAFFEKFCSLEDGSACERVVNEIFHKSGK